jgi:hypothetical protein
MTTRNLVPQYHVLLDTITLDDTELHQVSADIKDAATTSQIVLASPAMQASAKDVADKDTALTKSNVAVNHDRLQLHTDLGAEAQARSDLRRGIRVFAALVSANATSPADIQGAGLNPRPDKPKGATLDPTPPDQIVEKRPKNGHGKTVVAVHETGPTRHQYVAEQSLDGVTFTQLGVGHGKTRVVTGASGTKVWVRFAMVKLGKQSGWSTPLIVTLP